jgi:hypothetical protein
VLGIGNGSASLYGTFHFYFHLSTACTACSIPIINAIAVVSFRLSPAAARNLLCRDGDKEEEDKNGRRFLARPALRRANAGERIQASR